MAGARPSMQIGSGCGQMSPESRPRLNGRKGSCDQNCRLRDPDRPPVRNRRNDKKSTLARWRRIRRSDKTGNQVQRDRLRVGIR